MYVISRMSLNPATDIGVLMGAVVVHDEMHLDVRLDGGVEMFEELFIAMARKARYRVNPSSLHARAILGDREVSWRRLATLLSPSLDRHRLRRSISNERLQSRISERLSDGVKAERVLKIHFH